MKTLDTHGITHIEQVPGGTADWYFGISYEHGDLYEAEEIFKTGREVEGRELCLIRYPAGEVFRPVPKTPGIYPADPVFFEGDIYILSVDFPKERIQILRFDAVSCETELFGELPLSSVRDCYNLMLHTAPLTLTRQGGEDGRFDIVWPEQTGFLMGERESFFLRD